MEPATSERALELKTRRTIYDCIRRNPGLHFRELMRRMDMAVGTLEYNLHRLEQAGLVVNHPAGGLAAYFAVEDVDRRDAGIMRWLRNQAHRRLVLAILQAPGASFSVIAEAAKLHRSRASTLLKKLVDVGVLRSESEGRKKMFWVEDPDRVVRVLIRYRSSYADALVDRLAATWLG